MKFKVLIVFVFFVCCLLPGNNLAHNKVVVIPLIDDYNGIQTVTSAGGRVWMDRNLGAVRVAQSVSDHGAYGWLYQWGRLTDMHQIRYSSIHPAHSSGDIPGHSNFITVVSEPYDWRYTQNDNLWQPGTGLNNPCPAGFRVPTETEWETERASWSSNNSTGAFASPLKLVMAGYRSSNGTVFDAGSIGHYWSSNVITGSYSRYLDFGSGNAGVFTAYRANGMNVRCIKD